MMKTFNQYVESVEIEESRKSMSRLIQHFINDPYVIIMSVERTPTEVGFRDNPKLDKNNPQDSDKAFDEGVAENAFATGAFRTNLKQFRSGYIPIQGSYVETVNGKPREVIEHSFIIYCPKDESKHLYDFCIQQAKKYHQECILVVENGFGFFVDPHTNERDPIGMFYPDKIGQYFSTMVKKKVDDYYNKRHRSPHVKVIEKNFTFTTDVEKAQNTFVKILNQYRKHE